MHVLKSGRRLLSADDSTSDSDEDPGIDRQIGYRIDR